MLFYQRELDLTGRLLAKLRLNFWLLDPAARNSSFQDSRLKLFMKRSEEVISFTEQFPDFKPGVLYRVVSDSFCRFFFLSVPDPKVRRVLLVGPFLTETLSRGQMMEFCEKAGLSPAQEKKWEDYYSSLPILEESYVFSILYSLAETLYPKAGEISCVDVEAENVETLKNTVAGEQDSKPNENTFEWMEERYARENELIRAVSEGNFQKAQWIFSSFSQLILENRSADPVRNGKNYCIITNTILRKAAESGGVHPIYLDRCSSDFAKKIESLHSASSLGDLMHEMLNAYCKLVRKHAGKAYSPLIHKIILQIDNQLGEELSLKELAKKHNVSPGYLSTLFRKETGVTLSSFIIQKRMDHAKHLLKNTALQIQTVAQYCGFLDLNYFSRLFRKITGETPSQYRRSLHFSRSDETEGASQS